jgi:two-component system sensor histidine kinase AlgZ
MPIIENLYSAVQKHLLRLSLSKWQIVFLMIFAIWGSVGALGALAYFRDLVVMEVKTTYLRQLWRFYGLLLPLALLNCALYILFRERQDQLLRPRNLFILIVGLVLIFFPFYFLYARVFLFYRKEARIPNFDEILAAGTFVGMWMDSFFIFLSASAQIAFSFLHKSRKQMAKAYAARQGVLSLRLRHLQGQLEPSFLLSSLDSVSSLVLEADQSKATRALVRLGELLRYVLDSNHAEGQVSIADEINFLKDYLDLQNMRFADRLQIRWKIEGENWSDYQSPPMLLHPLIEFAVNAMHERLLCEQSVIYISCAVIDQYIQVVIRYSDVANYSCVAKFGLATAQEHLSLLFGTTATMQLIDDELSARLTISRLEPDLPNGLVLRFPMKLMHDE